MKKCLIVSLMLLSLLTLAACGTTQGDTTDSTDEASSTGSDTFRTDTEDLPQTADPTGQWLTGRTTSTSTPGTKDTVTRHGTVKHDIQDMLMSEEFGRLMDTMRDPLHNYTDEFSDLFANRWG